jgi:peroxisomal coenzyme A diphosphatase NUDT7
MHLIPKEVLDILTQKSRACIDNLTDYLATLAPVDSSVIHLFYILLLVIKSIIGSSFQSQSKLAAVLVLLYEQENELRVLLTTRSKYLRTHPGQTALPGGKRDLLDKDLTMTAVQYHSYI